MAIRRKRVVKRHKKCDTHRKRKSTRKKDHKKELKVTIHHKY